MKLIFSSLFVFFVAASAFFGVGENVVMAAEGDTTGAKQEYVLLASLPGLENKDLTNITLGEYIAYIYSLSIGLASVLAVLMLVVAGFQYMASDVPGMKTNAKAKIQNILLGLMLILVSYVLLNTINPELVSLKFSPPNTSSESIELSLEGLEIVLPQDDGGGKALYVPPSSVEKAWTGTTGVGSGQLFASQSDCKKATDTPCEQVTNPALSVPSNPPVFRAGMINIPAGDSRMNKTIPGNPYRKYSQFASKGNGEVNMLESVIKADAFIQKHFQERFGITTRLTSAYRDEAYNKCLKRKNTQGKCVSKSKASGACCNTSNNHQQGSSIDYGTSDLNDTHLIYLQELFLAAGGTRIGFGKNSSGVHLQWPDSNPQKVYWCYGGVDGPYKGNGTKTMPGFTKSTKTCKY